jgi:hypothetical protein
VLFEKLALKASGRSTKTVPAPAESAS